jgi:CIC family chloride channel protein
MSRPLGASGSLARRRAQLAEFARRSKEVVLLSAVVGAGTGLAVAAFEFVVTECLQRVDEAPVFVGALLPFVGLTATAIVLRYVAARATPSTADEYLQAFHEPTWKLDGRSLVGRMVAAVATLGSGCPMGLEGPSLYCGASLGDMLQRRLPRLFSARNRRVLLVAGAAAGVAAIFKAPATGAVFALEVPYQDDLARRMLLPSLVASVSGYLAFVAVHGTEPLLPVFGAPPFTSKDLVGAIVLGLVAGVGAQIFARMLRAAKRWVPRYAPTWRLPLAGATLGCCFAASRGLTGHNLATGTGYETIRWALEPSRGGWVIAAILALRCIGTTSSVGGGGVGGLFVPLVVAGALTGRLVGGAFNELDTSLFTVIGVAAFLGAGYRVPLAAVMFVAETTGRPGFVVPGVIAAVVAELLMGRMSVTTFQLALSGEQRLGADAPLDAPTATSGDPPPAGAAPDASPDGR